MTALFRIAIALLMVSLPSVADAQAQMIPGPNTGPIPSAPPGPGDYPNPTDIGWGGSQEDPCALPFPIALCDDMTEGGLTPEADDDPPKDDDDDAPEGDGSSGNGGLTDAADRVGEEIIDLAERNPVAGAILWIARKMGPSAQKSSSTVNESNTEDLSGGVFEVGGLPAVRSFAAFVDPVRSGGMLASTPSDARPRTGLMLHSKWEMNGDDDDEYVVRVTARRGRVELPAWFIARYGRLYVVFADRD